LGQVEWAGNSQEVLIEKLSRFRDEREFLLADVRTGAIRRVFHESDPAWVVASYGKNAGLRWIRDGRAFLVLSERDGWRHAYVYSRDGQELHCLTPGAYDIIERAVVDEDGGWFYYDASPDNATQKYLYRVRLDGTEQPERVAPPGQPGTHDYAFSPDAKWAFHTYSTFDTPPLTELVRLPEHRAVRVLEGNQELRAKMEALIAQPTEFLQLDIGDGVVMDAWMIKPSDFDPENMETPETNPEGYRRAAPIHFAEDLQGDLLIVHGTGETNTHLQITEGLVDRLIELGKPFDYMAYPNRDHGLRQGRGTAVHLRMLMIRYLLEHLPPGPQVIPNNSLLSATDRTR
jgi:dipeptidyl aminopeptidase/acylaminoacyl peptidase